MNSTLTLSPKTTTLVTAASVLNTPGTGAIPAVKTSRRQPLTALRVRRTLARKWDMYAVIGLMVSSAAYGIYALTYMTGF